MARALHADACRDHALVAWVVLWDLPAYPKRSAVACCRRWTVHNWPSINISAEITFD
jgi:hypothetical protein